MAETVELTEAEVAPDVKAAAAKEAEAANNARLLLDDTRMGVFEKAYLAAITHDMATRPDFYAGNDLGPWKTARRVRTIIERVGPAGINWQSSVAGQIAAAKLGVKESTARHWREWFKGDEAYSLFVGQEATMDQAAPQEAA